MSATGKKYGSTHHALKMFVPEPGASVQLSSLGMLHILALTPKTIKYPNYSFLFFGVSYLDPTILLLYMIPLVCCAGVECCDLSLQPGANFVRTCTKTLICTYEKKKSLLCRRRYTSSRRRFKTDWQKLLRVHLFSWHCWCSKTRMACFTAHHQRIMNDTIQFRPGYDVMPLWP